MLVIETMKVDRTGIIFMSHSKELDKTNNSTILKLFDKAMGILWLIGGLT